MGSLDEVPSFGLLLHDVEVVGLRDVDGSNGRD